MTHRINNAGDDMLDALDYLINLMQGGASYRKALQIVREELGIEDTGTLRMMLVQVAPIYGLTV